MKRRRIKRRQHPIVHILYFVFWGTMLVMFALLFISQMDSYNELRAELTRVESIISRERAENERLHLQHTFFDSDVYVESLARDRLGMVKENEIVFRNIAD
jgi:cell division protein DivIC